MSAFSSAELLGFRATGDSLALRIKQIDDGPRIAREFVAVERRVYGAEVSTESRIAGGVLRREYVGRQLAMIAELDGVPVARLLARQPIDEPGNGRYGTLSFFESIDDRQVARAILGKGVSWLHGLGVDEVLGPMEGDTWHRYRLNTGPHLDQPFFMEPTNPEYYPRLWSESGFQPIETYHSRCLDDVAPVAEKFAKIHERTAERGYELQPFDLGRFDLELKRLHRLSLTIFSQNRLYSPIGFDEFHALYAPVRSLIDPRLVWFATAEGGEDVGFLFAVHDYQSAVASMGGRDHLLAKLLFLINKRKADAINLKSMGVVPGHRRSGVGVALVCQVYRRMMEMGYRRANLCLIHDENPSARLDGGLGRVMRRYALYRHEQTG